MDFLFHRQAERHRIFCSVKESSFIYASFHFIRSSALLYSDDYAAVYSILFRHIFEWLDRIRTGCHSLLCTSYHFGLQTDVNKDSEHLSITAVKIARTYKVHPTGLWQKIRSLPTLSSMFIVMSMNPIPQIPSSVSVTGSLLTLPSFGF